MRAPRRRGTLLASGLAVAVALTAVTAAAAPLPRQPSLSVDDVVVTEGDGGATTEARFTVTLAPAASKTVSVDYRTVDGTAVAGGDYQAASGTLGFAKGQTSKQVVVRIHGDGADEPDERFFLTLASARNAVIARGTGEATIEDDDEAAPPPPPPSRTLTVSKAGDGTGTVSSDPGGIDCGSDCSESYENGTTVTLAAAAAPGSTFSGWSGACSGTGTCTVAMDADRSVTATFSSVPATTYLLNVSARTNSAGDGTVTSSPSGIRCSNSAGGPTDCSERYPAGTVVTLTASPASGSCLFGWEGDGTTGSDRSRVVTVDGDRSVTAVFGIDFSRLGGGCI